MVELLNDDPFDGHVAIEVIVERAEISESGQ
jgi:hypothetical protein